MVRMPVEQSHWKVFLFRNVPFNMACWQGRVYYSYHNIFFNKTDQLCMNITYKAKKKKTNTCVSYYMPKKNRVGR